MSTPVPTLPPSYVATGLVRGKSTTISIDSNDADLAPDFAFPQGSTLTFVASVQYLIFTKDVAPPDGNTFYFDPAYTGVVSATGDPATPNGGQLYLPANLGQTGNAQSWFWTVTPRISGRQMPSFKLDIPAGGVAYLSDQQPIPAAVASSSLLRGPAGPAGAAGVGAPPAGTPNGYVPVASSGTSLWVDPSTQPWVGGGGVTVQYNDDGTVTIAEGATARNIIYQHGAPTDPTLYAIGTFIYDVDTGILYEITP